MSKILKIKLITASVALTIALMVGNTSYQEDPLGAMNGVAAFVYRALVVTESLSEKKENLSEKK